jgi:hypothetical protein
MGLITDTLPKAQVEAPQFQVHISYLLQKCKKWQTHRNKFALLKNDITTSEPTVKILDT